MYIAPRLEVQYKDSTIVKINLFSGINGQQKVQAVRCWQNSRQIQQNNISSSQISVKALIELLTLPPADRQLISTGQNNCRSSGIDNKVQDVILSSMDENTFEFFFGVQPEPDTVYFGAQIEKDLPNRLFFGRDWFLLDEQGATINGQLLHTATLPDNSDFLLLSAMESENVDTAQLIVLPFSQLNMLTANADAPMAYLSVFLQSGQGIDDVQRIADWLQSRHPSYSYTVSDQRAELKKSIRDITQWMELFVWVAKCSLVITTVGIIGVLLIYVEQRRREFVIALTLGATHGTLIFELFCEVLLFSLLGGVISLLLTIFIAPQLSTVTFTVRFSWTCAILAIGIAFGITLICCVCTILGTRSRYPTKIL